MEYNILPFGEIWQSGIFNVPTALIEKYIKLASEYQLKSLLLILGNNGVYSSELIAKKLGITLSEADEFMEFWVAEGVAAVKGEAPKVQKAEPAQKPIDELKNEIMASIEKSLLQRRKRACVFPRLP